MGWWKVRDTEDMVGDDAFSLLRVAAKEVAKLYLETYDRMPTRSEWERLMRHALDPLDDDSSLIEDGERAYELTIKAKRSS